MSEGALLQRYDAVLQQAKEISEREAPEAEPYKHMYEARTVLVRVEHAAHRRIMRSAVPHSQQDFLREVDGDTEEVGGAVRREEGRLTLTHARRQSRCARWPPFSWA